MTIPISGLIAGFFLGLSMAAPPGPVNSVIAGKTTTQGWRHGFKIGFGAMSSDALFFALALTGSIYLHQYTPLKEILAIFGALLLMYLALSIYREDISIEEPRNKTGFIWGFLVGLTNPYQISWWFTVGLSVLLTKQIEIFNITIQGGPPIFLGFFLGILTWITVFPLAIYYTEKRTERVSKLIQYLSIILLLGFAAMFIYIGINGIF